MNLQSFHQQLLHSLTESFARGYNVALLLCGASTEETSALVDGSVVKQVDTSTLSLPLRLCDSVPATPVSGLGEPVWSSLVSAAVGAARHCVLPAGQLLRSSLNDASILAHSALSHDPTV